ncbi:MAG: RagB/SusD family nutrient uptake outer membrane protein [Bacteroidota bacterium]|nr:RagB/SusD family nutrient uptake outer membrane protein [Bacteroidota bacterium]
MKKHLFIILAFVVFASACKKESLQLPNPNQPTPASLATEAGIQSFAMGIFQKWVAPTSEGSANIMQLALTMHSNMGDEDFSPWANWGLRYPANVNTITLPAPYNKVIPNPSGFVQKGILNANNSRQAASANSIQYEWNVCYFMNSQANLLLSSLNNPALQFSGDAKTKKQILTAWAYWWKGFAYSRVGSMYIAGVINNESATGLTSGNFVDHNAIITEANVNFDKASTILNSLTANADYIQVFKAIVPSFNQNQNVITPAMWVRQINTYKARNFLVNRKIATMTAADWTQVTTLAANGMIPGDFSFMFGMNPGGTNDISTNFFHPFAIHSLGTGFAWVSERFIQDFKPGDARFTKNFELRPGGPTINVRSRGIQFGTRYNVKNIEDGGSFATSNSLGAISIGGTWEENALMVAEAKIRTGSDIEGGLAIIDQIRDAQKAGLAKVANTGLTQTQAIEEFRRERRIALYLRGVAFYDARRWGITASAANGGGRANANVLVPGDLIGSASAAIVPCFINYDFLDYWDVPQNELDFNAAEPGSAPIAN